MVDKLLKHIDVGEEIPDSLTWQSEALHELPIDSILLTSKPPSGFTRVKTIYLKEIDQELYLIT